MLLSMTGHGDATVSDPPAHLSVEIRSVNSRHFKLSARLPESCGSWHPALESIIRNGISRAHVNLQLNLTVTDDEAAVINRELLQRYHTQLSEALGDGTPAMAELLPALLSLPGVVSQRSTASDAADYLPLAEEAVRKALDNLNAMRTREGAAMADNLTENAVQISGILDQIHNRVPEVVTRYRERITAGLNTLLESQGSAIQPGDLVKEIAIFAERSDISEELVRLKSHLEQLNDEILADPGNGRTLDFLAQEMGREANTVGAKANDPDIASCVIALKTCIERIRELVQNVQ